MGWVLGFALRSLRVGIGCAGISPSLLGLPILTTSLRADCVPGDGEGGQERRLPLID